MQVMSLVWGLLATAGMVVGLYRAWRLAFASRAARLLIPLEALFRGIVRLPVGVSRSADIKANAAP